MSNVNVISVNPSKKTTGEINSEFWAKMARRCRVSETNHKLIRFKSVVNAITGINNSISAATSRKLLWTRLAIAAIFIYSAITAFSTEPAITVAIYLSLGAVTFSGFAQRPVMIAMCAVCTITGLFTEFAIVFGILAYFGPGIYSVDQLIRRKAFRAYKKSMLRRARHQEEQRLTYKAFQVAQ